VNLPDIRLIVTASCQTASRLASESLDRRLSFSERWALRLHTLICRSCRRFARQLHVLRGAVGRMPDQWRDRVEQQLVQLSPERKQEIKRLLTDSQAAESP
jgi:hypothetical protein